MDINKWVYGKNKRYSKSTKGTPVISGTTINNGTIHYTNQYDKEDVFKDSLTITTRGEYAGTVFYQEGEFVLANNILVLGTDTFDRHANLYLAGAIGKLYSGGNNYSNYPTIDKLRNQEIELPELNGEPNWELMAKYMRVMEKLTIKSLIDWKDREIEATRKVIN